MLNIVRKSYIDKNYRRYFLQFGTNMQTTVFDFSKKPVDNCFCRQLEKLRKTFNLEMLMSLPFLFILLLSQFLKNKFSLSFLFPSFISICKTKLSISFLLSQFCNSFCKTKLLISFLFVPVLSMFFIIHTLVNTKLSTFKVQFQFKLQALQWPSMGFSFRSFQRLVSQFLQP